MRLKRIGVAFLAVLLVIAAFHGLAMAKSGSVYVKGYFRKDGTYVRPHYRSAPDGNPYNNWSYPGNVNPYTGEVATGDPFTYLANYATNSRSTTTIQQNSATSAAPASTSSTFVASDNPAGWSAERWNQEQAARDVLKLVDGQWYSSGATWYRVGDPRRYTQSEYDAYLKTGVLPSAQVKSGSDATIPPDEGKKDQANWRQLSPEVLVFDFPTNSAVHSTRILKKGGYLPSYTVVGSFKNTTNVVLSFPKMGLYRVEPDLNAPLFVDATYVTPNTVRPGETGYYQFHLWSEADVQKLMVGLHEAEDYGSYATPTSWLQVTEATLATIKQSQYYSETYVTGILHNTHTKRFPYVDLLILYMDKEGGYLGYERWSVFGVAPTSSSPFNVRVFDVPAGVTSIEVKAFSNS